MRAIIAAMDGMLQPPSATALDAVASIISLTVYLAVAIAALARAPRDARTRVFLAVTLASAVPYVLAPLQWSMGTAVFTPPVIALTAVSFAVGSTALFHLTQIFPWRRPWIRAYGGWLAACYAVLPVALAVVAWVVTAMFAPLAAEGGTLGAVSLDASLVLLLVLPAVFVVGVVLPFGGAMSLFKSWQEARARGDGAARVTTFWMLMSQMAGGVLAVLVLPLLHVIGVGRPWGTILAVLTYAFGLLMPVAFAAAVWKYGILESAGPPSTAIAP
jgi:hypothetical protein